MDEFIHLRQLELRVVHHGTPWLDREALAQSGERVRKLILENLERLLRERLEAYGPDDVPSEIELVLDLGEYCAQPSLRSRPVVRRAGATERSSSASEQPPPLSLSARPKAPAAGSRESAPAAGSEPATATAAAPAPGTLLELLAGWHEDGSLERRLGLVPESAIERLWRETCIALDIPPPDKLSIAAAARPGPGRQPSPRSLREAIPALIGLAARHRPLPPPQEEVARLLMRVRRMRGGTPAFVEPDKAVAAETRQAASFDRALGETEQSAGSVKPLSAAQEVRPRLPTALRTTEVDNALPLLMLGPLGRIGWLDAAAAALEAAGLGQEAPALGFALALKALPAPARGWRHEPAQLHSAATAAGLAEPLSGERLAHLERSLGDRLALADAVVADALIKGRAEGTPLALVTTERWVALVEPEGLFALAIGGTWDDVSMVARAARAPLLAGTHSATPDLLAAAADDGLVFAAVGTPGRGERWRPVSGKGGWRGMTNAAASDHPRLGRAAARWDEQGEQRAVDLLNAFGEVRPIAAEQPWDSFGRSLALAATLALGDLAWRLAEINPYAWEAPDAGLAFERFGDLSARVTLDDLQLKVLLPLGLRSRDLLGAGYCVDVRAVPWLGGRTLRFGIG